jgi:hypothetical protein
MQAVRHFEEKPMRLVWTFAVVLAAMSPWPAASQSAPPAAEPYRPGLGDLMTMTVQPRHIKLALAGRESNWAYAKYELHELQEAFERIVRVWPKYKGLPLGGMVDAIAKGPMEEMAKAIQDKNSEQFAAAYATLTEGCNACHQAANVGLVVIKAPDASSFPDQDFRPQKP